MRVQTRDPRGAPPMSFLAALALAAAAPAAALPASLPSCSWDRPGHRAFTGDVVAAVNRYQDIPPDVRQRLQQRMAARRYDDIARIDRDGISGRYAYGPELREMHFAEGQVCERVTRDRWTPAMVERGLVYCEAGHCVIVPTVCRNVARVTRLPERVAAGGALSEELPLRSRAGDRTAAAATPAAPAAESAGTATAMPSAVATPAPASFDQLAPDLMKPGPGLPAPAAAPPAEIVVPPGILPQAGGAPAVLPQVLQDPAPAPLGNLDTVLPMLAWTTPFGPGPIPLAPRDNNGQPQPIPEPGQWAMWLAGLLVVLFLARRRS